MKLGVCAGCVENDRILWFSNFTFNGLFRYELNRKTMEFICTFDYINIKETGLHLRADIFENFIIFFPYRDRYVRLYDKSKNKLLSYKIPCNDDEEWFFEGSIVRHKIYFMSSSYEIYVFDLYSKTFIKDIKLINIVRECISKKSKRKEITISDSSIYIPDEELKGFYEIDIINELVQKRIMKKGFRNLQYIAFIKDCYWIICADSDEILCLTSNDEYIYYKYEGMLRNDSYLYMPYSRLYLIDDEIWITGYYQAKVFRLDEERKRIVDCFNLDESNAFKYPGYGAFFSGIYEKNGKVWVFPQRYNELIEYDISKKVVEKSRFNICSKKINGLVANELNKGFVIENPLFSLNDYIVNFFDDEELL